MKTHAQDLDEPVMPAPAQTVVFRADADTATGTGHVMRCLALAQALRDMQVPVVFITAAASPAMEERLTREGIRIMPIAAEPGSPADAAVTGAAARGTGASWIVIDGYRFGVTYQRQLKKSGLSLLSIDDTGMQEPCPADIILNQNLYADRRMYSGVPRKTQLLLGSRYALLRREFMAAQKRVPVIRDTASRILVTLGGSDPENRSHDIIRAIMRLPPGSCEVRVIIGGYNPHYRNLATLAKTAGHAITIFHDVADMAGQYLWSDITICGGGSTTLELACLGVPMITVVIAENQVQVCKSLAEAGAAVNAGTADRSLEERVLDLLKTIIPARQERADMSLRARLLVDGMGSCRVALCLCENSISLRDATPADCGMIFGWINEPYVRQQSFHTSPISAEEHSLWYLAKMEDRTSRYYIVQDRNGTPVGQVRYDISGTEAIISILIDPGHRGNNYGTLAMRRSARILFEETKVTVIHAYVRKTNPISCRAFANAGFVLEGITERRNTEAYHLTLRRP